IGTGPFKFVEWVKGDHFSLEANKDYWGGAPNADTVLMKPYPEDAARVASLLAGDTNIIDTVQPDQIARINSNANTQVVSAFVDGNIYMTINTTVAPLDNKGVRQAMSLAIDRGALVKNLLANNAKVPNSFLTDSEFAYNPNKPPYPYDPAKAKDIL